MPVKSLLPVVLSAIEGHEKLVFRAIKPLFQIIGNEGLNWGMPKFVIFSLRSEFFFTNKVLQGN